MRRVSSNLAGYLIALISVALAIGITFAILHTSGFRAAIGYAYLFAILVSAWLGYGPGLLACGLSFFVAPYLFVPHFVPTRVDLNRLVLTLLVALLVSRVSHIHKRAERLLRLANEELEQRVKQRTADLERSNAELEQYAYVASHDLQEPLRTINTMAALFVRRYRGHLDANADELLGYIEASVDRMQRLINDLLAYSRALAEEQESRTPVDLESTLQHAIAACGSDIEETGAMVTYDHLPILGVDATQVGQVFQNLVSNAIKYRKPDQPPCIHIGARQAGPEWTFSVVDNGIGIASDYHERIFGLFKRLHGTQIPGTGIGLAICKKIVERHKGRIWVESSPGSGSTFHFTLPATQDNRS